MGFWKPIIAKVRQYYPDFDSNKNFKTDMFNIVVGMTWQISLVLLPMTLITKEYQSLAWACISILVTSIVLKFSWWNKLDEFSQQTLPADFDARVLQTAAPSALEQLPVPDKVKISK